MREEKPVEPVETGATSEPSLPTAAEASARAPGEGLSEEELQKVIDSLDKDVLAILGLC